MRKKKQKHSNQTREIRIRILLCPTCVYTTQVEDVSFGRVGGDSSMYYNKQCIVALQSFFRSFIKNSKPFKTRERREDSLEENMTSVEKSSCATFRTLTPQRVLWRAIDSLETRERETNN